jgi:hypothetical protein
MGGIIGNIRRGIAGGGAALEETGSAMVKSTLDEQRQTRLAELQNEFQTARDTRTMAHQTSERQGAETFTAGQNDATRAHQTAEKGLDRTLTRDEGSANRLSQENMNVDRISAQLYLGELADDRAKEHLQIERVRAGTQARLAEIQAKVANLDLADKTQLSDMKKEYLNPSTPADRREAIADSIYTLLGKDKFSPLIGKDEQGNPQFMGAFNTRSGKRETGEGGGAAATGAKWDSGSGRVMLDGRVVGTAKSEGEARSMIAKARGGGKAAPSSSTPAGPAVDSSAPLEEPPMSAYDAPVTAEEDAAAQQGQGIIGNARVRERAAARNGMGNY